MRYTHGVAAVAVFLLVSCGHVAPKDAQSVRPVDTMVEAYLTKRPMEISAGMPYADALGGQKEFTAALEKRLGERAGYKVGLVTPAAQQRYNIPHPIRGVLFKKMLLPDGSEVSANYGTRPIVEPDLMVRVKDAAINNATSAREAMAHLSEIICFIELADGTLATNMPVDGAALTASNVGARNGILGQTRAVENTSAFYDAFGKMDLVLRDASGKEVSRVTADGVMGHPMNAVLWLINDLKKTGEKLKAGDVISLGSPSPAATPRAGDRFILAYEGLPGGTIEAKVSFK
ncbi:MAG: 2-keto-4-pentenoate hydratase [Limisphaerales bacterium]